MQHLVAIAHYYPYLVIKMSKYEIKRLDVWSLTKFMAVWGLVIGFIIGLVSAILLSLFNPLIYVGVNDIGSLPVDIAGLGTFTAAVLIIVYPIISGIIGLVAGVITGLLYNFVAALVGGIQVQLTEGTVPVPDSQAMSGGKK